MTELLIYFSKNIAVPGGVGQPQIPSEMDWDKFRERFERVSKKIVVKMTQNAGFMATTIKKSWQQIIREVTGGGGGGSGRERP